MRDLKFRAWDKLNKRMIYDYFWISSDGNLWRDQDPHGLDMSGRKKIGPTDKLNVMQHTGLKDKNGKDIYEGDLIRFAEKYLYVVRFEDAKFVGYHANNDWGKWGDIYKLADSEFDKYGYYVIGNIYENPDLIPQST